MTIDQQPTPDLLWCPLCDWTKPAEVQTYADSNREAAPAVARALGMSADALLAIHTDQARKRDEATLERHFRTHGPTEWLPALMTARTEAERAKAQLQALPHLDATPTEQETR